MMMFFLRFLLIKKGSIIILIEPFYFTFKSIDGFFRFVSFVGLSTLVNGDYKCTQYVPKEYLEYLRKTCANDTLTTIRVQEYQLTQTAEKKSSKPSAYSLRVSFPHLGHLTFTTCLTPQI